MTSRLFLFPVLAGFLAHGVAAAISPCCAPKPCPPGKVAMTGTHPTQAKCCVDYDDPTTCESVPNAGWYCASMRPYPSIVTAVGCEEVSDHTCVGGQLALPAGCVQVAGQALFTGESCTASAVDACCSAGACRYYGPGGGCPNGHGGGIECDFLPAPLR
jgi:hypothetical protein